MLITINISSNENPETLCLNIQAIMKTNNDILSLDSSGQMATDSGYFFATVNIERANKFK